MALTFNGVSYVAKSSALVAAAPMSFSCWFNPTSVAANAMIMGIASSTTTHSSFFAIQFLSASDKVCCSISSDKGDVTDLTALHATTISINTWYHVCGVFTSTTSRTIYVNGAGAVSSAVSVTPGTCDSTYIGALIANGALVAGLIGAIADPAIWNVALTATDVAALATGGGPTLTHPTGLVANPLLSGGDPKEPDAVSSTRWNVVLG